jgi:hypothetical protein
MASFILFGEARWNLAGKTCLSGFGRFGVDGFNSFGIEGGEGSFGVDSFSFGIEGGEGSFGIEGGEGSFGIVWATPMFFSLLSSCMLVLMFEKRTGPSLCWFAWVHARSNRVVLPS